MKLAAIIFFILGLAALVTSQSACNVTSIENCIAPLDKYNINQDILFPQFKRPQLTQLCLDYELVEECLQPIKPSCNLYRRRHYEGLEAAYDYICGDGFEVYLTNYYCWGDEPLRLLVRQCNVSYQNEVRATMSDAYIYTHLEINERICQHLNDYMFCIKDTVKNQCNSSSADWQHEVNVRSMAPVLREMNCTIHRPALSGGEIAGIVIGCLVFVVLVVLLIYYCTCNVDNYRKKQKLYLNQQQKAKSNPSVRPAPSSGASQSVSQPSAPPPQVIVSAPTPDQHSINTSLRSSLRKPNKTPSNSGRHNLSFADDMPSIHSGAESSIVGENTYNSLPSYTQALRDDPSYLDESYPDESGNWQEEEPQTRPKGVPRLF